MYLQNVKEGQYEMIKCHECGGTEFSMAVQLFLVPPKPGEDKPGVLVSKVYVCNNCHTVIDLHEIVDSYSENKEGI